MTAASLVLSFVVGQSSDFSGTAVAMSVAFLLTIVAVLMECAQTKKPENAQAPPPPNEASAVGPTPGQTPAAPAPSGDAPKT
ncbi:hypothetical protein TTRE_0000146101 [Trichuris trichiura]|uniref:Uncharacterized protein n=1 Tax=Trichuris trichiura TaxID=36087 RepID=A0A077Z0J8_TRITR|nr:hypothetical protein TTRE_0000146101 [Trichuris trichiura]